MKFASKVGDIRPLSLEWIYPEFVRNCASDESFAQTFARRRQPEHRADGAGAQPVRDRCEPPARRPEKAARAAGMVAGAEPLARGGRHGARRHRGTDHAGTRRWL